MNASSQSERAYLTIMRGVAGAGTALVLLVFLPKSTSELLHVLPVPAIEAICGTLLFWGCAAPILQLGAISFLGTLAWRQTPVSWMWVACVFLLCLAHVILLTSGSAVERLAPLMLCAIAGMINALLIEACWFRQKPTTIFAIAFAGAGVLFFGMVLALEVAKSV
jgi:hypothetical protein